MSVPTAMRRERWGGRLEGGQLTPASSDMQQFTALSTYMPAMVSIQGLPTVKRARPATRFAKFHTPRAVETSISATIRMYCVGSQAQRSSDAASKMQNKSQNPSKFCEKRNVVCYAIVWSDESSMRLSRELYDADKCGPL